MSDNRYRMVTCRTCGRYYRCTPEDDYYNGGDPEDSVNGMCFSCLLKAAGLNPEATPTIVIDESGREIDPRDNN